MKKCVYYTENVLKNKEKMVIYILMKFINKINKIYNIFYYK